MNESAVATLLTTEDLLALPEDGVERELIRGRLVEKPMTRRNPQHSAITSNVSYSDRHEEISDKIEDYLAAGVPLVWIIDPAFRTVCIYRPDAAPELFHEGQALTAEPHLPGLRVPVAEIFE